MNFAKYIVARIWRNLNISRNKLCELSSISFKMISHLSAFYEFRSHQNSKNGPKWTHFAKIACRIAKSKHF